MDPAPSKILVPVRYAAWLAGELGRQLEDQLRHALGALPQSRVMMLPRGFLVEADETPGVLLEAVHRAVHEVEEGVQRAFPVFWHEMGPLWTGTLQAVFPATARRGPVRREARPAVA